MEVFNKGWGITYITRMETVKAWWRLAQLYRTNRIQLEENSWVKCWCLVWIIYICRFVATLWQQFLLVPLIHLELICFSFITTCFSFIPVWYHVTKIKDFHITNFIEIWHQTSPPLPIRHLKLYLCFFLV